MAERQKFKCHDCRHVWEPPGGAGRLPRCPQCKSGNIHKEAGRGMEGGGRGRSFGGGRFKPS